MNATDRVLQRCAVAAIHGRKNAKYPWTTPFLPDTFVPERFIQGEKMSNRSDRKQDSSRATHLIVKTCSFGKDYPDESFLSGSRMSEDEAETIAEILNRRNGTNATQRSFSRLSNQRTGSRQPLSADKTGGRELQCFGTVGTPTCGVPVGLFWSLRQRKH